MRHSLFNVHLRKWERPTLLFYFAMMLKFQIFYIISFSSAIITSLFIHIYLHLSPSRSLFSVSAFQYFEIFNCNWCYLQRASGARICKWISMRIQNSILNWILQTTVWIPLKSITMKKEGFHYGTLYIMHVRSVRDLRERKYLNHAIEKWSVNFFGSQYITICKGKRIITLVPFRSNFKISECHAIRTSQM